jgi:hypothetical protein
VRKDVLRQCNPKVVFLSETHLDTHPVECLRRSLHMDGKIVSEVMVEVEGLSFSGRRRLRWSRFLQLQIILM